MLPEAQGPLAIRYGKRFLDAYTGKISADPDVALTELVANAWDAGALNVHLTIPGEVGGKLIVEDDGTGMTRAQFEERWAEFSYNRLAKQSVDVEFPPDVVARPRRAFGRNGKGRHALFCFASSYTVLTWRDGELNEFEARRESSSSESPITIVPVAQKKKHGHGTKLVVKEQRQLLDAERLKSVIGSRFIGFPDFRIHINGELVERVDLAHLVQESSVIHLASGDRMIVSCIDTQKPGRTMQQTGQVWWVHKRLVEETKWDGIDRKLLDGRTAQAKRFTFIIEADFLEEDVLADWTGFRASERVRDAREKASEHVETVLNRLLLGSRKVRRSEILSENAQQIRELAPSGRRVLTEFVDEVLRECPGISQKDLANAAKVLIKLEHSRSKYSLLRQLASRTPGDLDTLNEILATWDVNDARLVLDELNTRLELIRDMTRLVHDRGARELHDLQPLFQRGLWIFGPEYETVEFTSNQTLATVLRDLFGGGTVESPRDRPDFVVLPDGSASLSVESRDRYEGGEPTGRLAQVLILELKRGAASIGDKELTQAMGYARAIRRSGQVVDTTEIVAFVLGGAVDPLLEKVATLGEHTKIFPLTFDGVLRRAQSRTFHLLERIKRQHPETASDSAAAADAQRAIDDVFARPVEVREETASSPEQNPGD